MIRVRCEVTIESPPGSLLVLCKRAKRVTGSYRASSSEMTARSSDETPDSRDRKTAHKTRLERRRPFGSDEMAAGRAPFAARDPLAAAREPAARAHRRLLQRHMIKRLMAEIKRQHTKRVWNAIDRSEAMKWRTFMPAEAARRPSRSPRLWSGRTSSREIKLTSSDETAEGRYR